jgi:hypothetical protein
MTPDGGVSSQSMYFGGLKTAQNPISSKESNVHPCVAKNHPSRKNDRYFDFQHVEFSAYIDICEIFVSVMLYSHL